MEENKHYVCRGGCGLVTENQYQACSDESCGSYGDNVTECGCSDGNHY